MNQLSTSVKLTLIGVFLLAVVIITAILDMNFHFDKFVVIAIMIVASVAGMQMLTSHDE